MASGSHRSGSNSSSIQESWWWDAIEIVEEDGKRYRVRWAGKDETGKPWPLDWVPNSHCSADLIRDWEKKKGKAKKQESLSSLSVPKSLVAFKRPYEKRDAASTSKPPALTPRKRKQATPSGSAGNVANDSAPPKKKRLAAAVESTPSGSHGGQSTAPAHALPNIKDHPTTTEDLPSHPPLEEIEMWVPTSNAKFGPPKRKSTAGKRREPPKKVPVDIAVPTKTPVPATPIPLQLLPRPLSLTKSQIFALREEEEESQPTSNQPSGTINNSATSNPSPPTVRAKDNVQPTNPNVNNGRGASSPSKSSQMEKSSRGKGGNTKEPHIPVFNFKPPASAISSSKSPQTEKSVKTGPSRIGKPDTGSIKQHSPSRSEPPQPGTFASFRTIEALRRLNELVPARKTIESVQNIAAKGHPTLETSQSSEQPPPHVIFKRVMDCLESPNGSQVTHLGNSANKISTSASPGGNRRVDPSKSQEGLVINKSGQDVNMGSLSSTGGVPAAKVLVPSSEDEVPPTASNSTQSQSHDALPHASPDSQLAAALDLLHKKSEEIADLRIQLYSLRARTTEQAGNGVVHVKEATAYLATEVQTDRDNEAYKDWNLERTRWAEEKLTLQGEAETLRGEKGRALADVDFFRAQYQKASEFASSMRSENEELSERAALAESQATKGVALVRATLEGRVAKLEAEVQKYKALSDMLTVRARRTDDDVRLRAALAPEIEREFRLLEGRFSELEAELEETKDELFDEKRRNSKLRRRVARLESKAQAAGVGQYTEEEQDHTLWSDEKDDGDYNPTRSPSSSPTGGSSGSSPQPQRQEDHSPHNEDDAAPADGEIVQLDSFGLGESAQSSNDDMVYLCRWRPGEPAENCDAVASTKEELHEHVLSHHLACH